MVAYGPWMDEEEFYGLETYAIDDPRYIGVNAGIAATQAIKDVSLGEERYRVDNRDLLDILRVALDRYGEDSPWSGTEIAWRYDLSYPVWTSRWSATVTRHPFSVAAPSEGIMFWPAAPIPDDAIGIEYEGYPAPPEPTIEPLMVGKERFTGAYLDPRTDISGVFTEGTHTGLPFLSFVPDTDILCGSAGGAGVAGTIPGLPDGGFVFAELNQMVDLTDFLSGWGWSGVVSTLTSAFVPPQPPSDPTLEAPEDVSGLLRYGWRLVRITMRWTALAPRHRFVYDSVPIQQTTHRDDHLAGGAYQTWPAPTSRQMSNTTFGGYL